MRHRATKPHREVCQAAWSQYADPFFRQNQHGHKIHDAKSWEIPANGIAIHAGRLFSS
jgi:hypothetical protein